MKLGTIIAAAGLAFATVGGATAADAQYDRHHDRGYHDGGRWHDRGYHRGYRDGPRWHHRAYYRGGYYDGPRWHRGYRHGWRGYRHCWIEWRHHHRVRICR